MSDSLMFRHSARMIVLCLFATQFGLTSAQTTAPYQTPLLTRGTSVEPNITIIFDDSGSMSPTNGTFLYQDSAKAAWASSSNIGTRYMGVEPTDTQAKYARCSPQVNQLYYDSAQLYLPTFASNGIRLTDATIPTIWPSAPTGSLISANYAFNEPAGVCKDASSNPIYYKYKGPGPRYLAPYTFNVLTSYDIVPIKAGLTYPASSDRICAVPTTSGACCSGSTCTSTQEFQNLANWLKWHSNRLDMAKTATKQSFIDLPPTFRLGWGKLSKLGASTPILDAGVSIYNSTVRTNFINFLNGISTPDNNSTPTAKALIAVGEYHKRTDSDGPWGSTPNPSSTKTTTQTSGVVSPEAKNKHATCRRSAAILITDGYYADTPPDIGDFDGVDGTTMTSGRGGTWKYIAGLPYKDTRKATIADIAMKYWVTDLRTDTGMTNNITPIPGVDEAFWQHLNFYAIGLGVDGTLNQTDPATRTGLNNGTIVWPAVATYAPASIDDIWHGTLNARGGMLNAGNATQLSASLQSMIGQILKASSSQAGVAVSTVQLQTDSLKFVPVYTTGEWTGNIIANTLDATTGNELTIAWQAETKDSVSGKETNNTLTPDLSVAFASRSHNARKIYVGAPAPTGTGTVAFTYSAMGNGTTGTMSKEILPGFTGQVVDETLISYLRGDRSNETTFSGSRNYRIRPLLLGDVVNSTPQFVKPASGEGALFVGANDGMLHVFGETDGREIMAYVPRAVLPTIAKLADTSYQHQYYVDGPITQGVFGGTNKIAVVGTTGAGARAVFALDATTPTTMNASSVLWEVRADANTTGDWAELGYVLSDVRIAKLSNGDWAAIFGNGYYSKSGKAQLFIVNMTDGSLIKKIDTLAAGSTTNPNGLGGVRVVTENGKAIGVYGGDLLGNMWKFDLSDSSSNNWKVAFGTTTAPKPLYIAKARTTGTPLQTITASPFVMKHPSGGYMVAFSTGKFFDLADASSTETNGSYGIRDKTEFGVASIPNPTTSQISGIGTLVQQTFVPTKTVTRTITAFDNTTSTQDVTYYGLTNTTVDYVTQDGWYFDLPIAGQRTIYPVDAIIEPYIRIDTMAPGAQSSDPCAASAPGVAYNYIVDAINGGSPGVAIFDTDGDGFVNESDEKVLSGYSTTVDGRNITLKVPPKPEDKTCPPGTTKFIDLSSQNDALVICIPDPSTPPKTTVKRTWRQLFIR